MVSEDSQLPESFLLIVRTSRIVTDLNSKSSSGGFTDFPAYSRLRSVSSPIRGAANPSNCKGHSYLRHICYYSK
jgi:hypothetical protein